jgi:3-isopropylmalate/(R)-2-methylmalate dehydratase large subunit
MTNELLDLGPAPRILFLSNAPELVRRQLAGEALSLRTAGPLRNDVSTDEITPVAIMSHYDQRLARFPYTGLRCGTEAPIAAGAVQAAGFQVTVAGRRYGKGSSREHSPAAERLAGIRLVIAESFERLYRQNADNISLFTSTDFGLLERITRGKPIPIEELLAGREPLAGSILREGGLLRFGQRHLRARAAVPSVESSGPQTLFEKIIRRHLLETPVTPSVPGPGEGCFLRADWRFIHEYYTGMAAHMMELTLGPRLALHEPSSIVVFEDHTSYVEQSPAHLQAGLVPNMQAMRQAQRDFVARHELRCHRTLTDSEAAVDDGSNVTGISHAMMAELYALPGQVVVGTDSHTPHSGALGCVAFGVGTTDMANAFATGAVRMTMPRVLRVQLDGALQAGVTAKDVVLHLLALPDLRDGGGLGKVFEFGGTGTSSLSTDERATLTNMTAELGGLTGIAEPDEETVRFLRERRGASFQVEPWMRSDAGASYERVIAVDCSQLGPMLAAPGDPGNGIAVEQLGHRARIASARLPCGCREATSAARQPPQQRQRALQVEGQCGGVPLVNTEKASIRFSTSSRVRLRLHSSSW